MGLLKRIRTWDSSWAGCELVLVVVVVLVGEPRDSIMALVCGFCRAIWPRRVPRLLVCGSLSGTSKTQGMCVLWRNGWLAERIPVVKIPSGLD